jgi:hypothetical protein
MSCVRTFVTLRVFSPRLAGGEISAVLGLQPSGSRDRNPAARVAKQREYSIWKWSTKGLLESRDDQDHLELLLSNISKLRGEFEYLRNQDCLIDVFCYFESDGQGGPSLTSTQMASLSLLGLDIAWDIYFDEPPRDSRSE